MKKLFTILLSVIGATAFMLTGCIDRPDEPKTVCPEPDAEHYDYATTDNVTLNVDYSMKGNKAQFEVYAEAPVTEKDGALVKKEGVKALLKTYTDNDCRYSGSISLPTAAETVWLYSESYGLPTCIEVKVDARVIAFNMQEYYQEMFEQQSGKSGGIQALSSTRANSDDNPYNIQTLGEWTWNGQPLYIVGERYDEVIIPDRVTPPSGLMNRIQNVLMPGTDNSKYAKVTKVVNLNVTKEAHLTLVFAAEMAEWRNAIGYYYYDTQNPPKTQAEFDALPKYVAFPNCSSFTTNFDEFDFGATGGSWTDPLWFGEQLQLQYFKDGKSSTVFPQGTTVGWFMLPDGYKITTSSMSGKLDMTSSAHPIRYSNNEFNAGSDRYMVSLYDKSSGKTILGFEDGGDNDYKDVLFYINADPADAIDDSDRPTTDPDDEKYPDITGDAIEGTLAFEDLWPSQGDYDMNDVVVKYSTAFTVNKDNGLVAIKDVFTPLHRGGKVKSAFGYELDMPATHIKSVTIENGSSSANVVKGLEINQDKAVIMLFDDIETAIAQGPITVTIELDGSVSMNTVTHKSLYNPFICVSDDGFVPGEVRKEVHLTNYLPTSLADLYPFGKYDDKSSVDKDGKPVGPYYYTTSEMYPFAIDLPVTDYRIPDEMVKMGTFYPQFVDWVESKGEKYRDWYLHPAK